MELPENLLCLFTAQVTERDDSYVIEIPQQEVATGAIENGDVYRVALLPQVARTSPSEPESAPEREREGPKPPVSEDDVLDVEIEDIGEQGDGIARIGPGYVVIVPDTELGERVSVRITEVRENLAFAEVVERYDRMS